MFYKLLRPIRFRWWRSIDQLDEYMKIWQAIRYKVCQTSKKPELVEGIFPHRFKLTVYKGGIALNAYKKYNPGLSQGYSLDVNIIELLTGDILIEDKP